MRDNIRDVNKRGIQDTWNCYNTCLRDLCNSCTCIASATRPTRPTATSRTPMRRNSVSVSRRAWTICVDCCLWATTVDEMAEMVGHREMTITMGALDIFPKNVIEKGGRKTFRGVPCLQGIAQGRGRNSLRHHTCEVRAEHHKIRVREEYFVFIQVERC